VSRLRAAIPFLIEGAAQWTIDRCAFSIPVEPTERKKTRPVQTGEVGRKTKGVIMPKMLIDINELSRRLSIAKGTLYNWVSQGRLPFKKIGRCLRFDWEEIEDMFTRSTMGEASKR
jgi:excisionase family DNA binding protein